MAVVIFNVKISAPLLFCLILTGCHSKPQKKVHRSFYYWKSSFQLSERETGILSDLSISTLFVKFFDVSWDAGSRKPQPVARISFREKLPDKIKLIPVVFLTNETLLHIKADEAISLAGKMAGLIQALAPPLHPIEEIQIDCDWTATTRDIYFQLLSTLQKHPFLKAKKLSVTIRLHQLKYKAANGIPPADKALLMCYNMGNLRNPETTNSIIDPAELKKYTGGLGGYPLRLDVALPLFNWFVLFHNHQYKGLLHTYRVPSLKKENRIFQHDTIINNFRFDKGDWLRFEESTVDDVLTVAKEVNSRIRQDELHIVLYHLDEPVLTKYKIYDLEAIFNSFR